MDKLGSEPFHQSPKMQPPASQAVKIHVPQELLSASTNLTPKKSIEKAVMLKGQEKHTSQDVHPDTQHVQATVKTSLVPDRVQAKEEAPVTYVDRSQLQKSTFETVTRNIKNCDQLLAEAAEKRFQNVERLCGAVEKGDWKKIIESYEGEDPRHLAIDALKAFHDKEICVEQFCTLTYLYALLKEFPGLKIHVQSLFNADGSINKNAQESFQQGLGKHPLFEQTFFTNTQANQIGKELFVRMQDRPASEQCFFYIEYTYLPGKWTISNQLRMLGLCLFDRFTTEKLTTYSKATVYRMIPSFSMIQACVDAYGKENTIALCPIIGVATRSDVRQNASERGRIIYTPFHGFSVPSSADGFVVRNSFDFLFHDIYHCLICSQVPEHLRQETGVMADLIASLQKQIETQPSDENVFFVPFLDALYGRMIDMEFAEFRRTKTPWTPEQLFLLEIEKQTTHAKSRMTIKLSALPTPNAREGLSESARANLEKWDKLKAVPLSQEERLKQICDSKIAKLLAGAIYRSGLLTRLGLTKEQLEQLKWKSGSTMHVIVELQKLFSAESA